MIDPVGEPFAESALRSLRAFGRYLVIGSPAVPSPGCRSTASCWKTARSSGSTGVPGRARTRPGNQRLIADVLGRVAAGALQPVAPQTYPLKRTAEALNALARRQITGKLALLP